MHKAMGSPGALFKPQVRGSEQKPSSDHTVSSVKTNDTATVATTDEELYERPTKAEERTLRRVPGNVPWIAYTIAFVELCERFSFFGTTAVCEYPLRYNMESPK